MSEVVYVRITRDGLAVIPRHEITPRDVIMTVRRNRDVLDVADPQSVRTDMWRDGCVPYITPAEMADAT